MLHWLHSLRCAADQWTCVLQLPMAHKRQALALLVKPSCLSTKGRCFRQCRPRVCSAFSRHASVAPQPALRVPQGTVSKVRFLCANVRTSARGLTEQSTSNQVARMGSDSGAAAAAPAPSAAQASDSSLPEMQTECEEALAQLYKWPLVGMNTHAHNEQAALDRLYILHFRGYDVATAVCRGHGILDGGEKQQAAAIEVLSKSKEPLAKFLLGQSLMGLAPAWHSRIDRMHGVELTRSAADAGLQRAQLSMGIIYEKGIKGIEKDVEQAIQWFTQAASQNFALAQYSLGRLMEALEEFEEAEHWYVKAAEQGYVNAEHRLGKMFAAQKQNKKAREWLETASKRGSALSQMALGDLLVEGARGQTPAMAQQRRKAALRWFRQAAQAGYVQAMVRLSTVLLHPDYVVAPVEGGRGKHKQQHEHKHKHKHEANDVKEHLLEEEEALHWLEEAGRSRDRRAMYTAGQMLFARGSRRRDPQVLASAMYWLKEAGEAGHGAALDQLGFMYHHGKGVEQNYDTALKFYTQAIKMGHLSSHTCLGILYEHGHGVTRDIQEAARQYGLAIEAGHRHALSKLKLLMETHLPMHTAEGQLRAQGILKPLEQQLRRTKTFLYHPRMSPVRSTSNNNLERRAVRPFVPRSKSGHKGSGGPKPVLDVSSVLNQLDAKHNTGTATGTDRQHVVSEVSEAEVQTEVEHSDAFTMAELELGFDGLLPSGGDEEDREAP